MRDRLTIPYQTRAGVVSLKARTLTNQQPKYTGLTGVDPHIYGTMDLHKDSDIIAITEGELDTIVMSEVVGIPSVGIPGVGTWKSWMFRAFAGYTRVFVVVDSDEAGQGLADKIVHDLRDQAVLVPPPGGMDLNEWVLKEGPEAIRRSCGL